MVLLGPPKNGIQIAFFRAFLNIFSQPDIPLFFDHFPRLNMWVYTASWPQAQGYMNYKLFPTLNWLDRPSTTAKLQFKSTKY